MIGQLRDLGHFGTIFDGKEDHGIRTISIRFHGTTGEQDFGGIAFDKEDEANAFKTSLCDFFGVNEFQQLIGIRCYALRSFATHNEPIEGLERLDTGERWTLTQWRKDHYPNVLDPLSAAKQTLERQIAQLERDLNACKVRLGQLEYDYIDWQPHDQCEDCGARGIQLSVKGDHHGGTKVVCVDRDSCHYRTTHG